MKSITNTFTTFQQIRGAIKKISSTGMPLTGLGHLVLSRIIILAIVLITQASADIARGSAGQYINLDGFIDIPRASKPSRSLLKADIGWYKDIADSGYDPGPFKADGKPESQRNWAFFPGWPIFWKMSGLGKANAASGIAAANILYISSIIALAKFLRKSNLTTVASQKSFFLLSSYYPFGYFFSLPLPESLFSACTAVFLLTIPNKKSTPGNLALNCLAGFAAGLTRPTGIFSSIFPVAGICKLIATKERSFNAFAALVASALSPLIGLGCFMLYLHQQTGNFLAFKEIQIAWGRSGGVLLEGLAKALSPEEILKITHYSNFRIANLTVCLLMLTCAFVLLHKGMRAKAHGNSFKYINLTAIAVYLLLLIASCSSDNQVLLSFSRIAGANPIFFAAVAICLKPAIIEMATPLLALLLGAFSSLAVVGFDAFAA